MSYYKCKNILIEAGTEIVKLNIAASNVVPISYFWSEYGVGIPFKEKMTNLCVSLLNGNIYPLSSCNKLRNALGAMKDQIGNEILNEIFEFDLCYKTNLTEKLYQKLAELIGVPTLLKENIDISNVNQKINVFLQKCKLEQNITMNEWQNKKIIPIQTALRSDVVKDYVVLIDREDNIFFTKEEHYEIGKLFFNDDCVSCGKYSRLLWILLTGEMPGWSIEELKNYYSKEDVANAIDQVNIALKGKEISVLPYVEYKV